MAADDLATQGARTSAAILVYIYIVNPENSSLIKLKTCLWMHLEHLTLFWSVPIISIPGGHFNFQAVLHSNGEVSFAYRDVPVNVGSISSAQHPVKVGLSDAYYMDRQVSPDVRKRTIYEYHRVSVPTNQVHSGAAVKIVPLPSKYHEVIGCWGNVI